MSIDLSQFHQLFFEESAEHLASMEDLLLSLDLDAPDIDQLNAIFRAAHSIKGSSGTFGFHDMIQVTHELETLLDLLRKGSVQPTADMVDLMLEARDVIQQQLASHQHGHTFDEAQAESIIQKLQAMLVSSRQQAQGEAPATPALSAANKLNPLLPTTWLLEFPTPAGVDDLIEGLSNEGEVKVLYKGSMLGEPCQLLFTGIYKEQDLRNLLGFVVDPDALIICAYQDEDPAQADFGLFDDLEKTEDDSFGFFEFEAIDPPQELEDSTLTPLTQANPIAEEDEGFGLFYFDDDEPAIEQPTSDLSTQDVTPDQTSEQQDHLERQRGYGFFQKLPPIDAPPPTEQTLNKATPATTTKTPTSNKAVTTGTAETSIRVSVDKVDQLINQVGELVITQSMILQAAIELEAITGKEKLLDALAQLERNTRDMQESVMAVRMLPISVVFSRFPRVVRDLARKLNKKIDLKMVGENTELDRSLIEKISDPLTHLIRNSLDHGIELPEERLAKGKQATGTIVLRAAHKGGNILIEIQDDGAGLNRERILAKARERNIPVSDHASDQEVWQLIFAPGFSTAAEVTDVSGRGVGMDVVRRNITNLGGGIEIDSIANAGTRISIRLPLTLAILDGLSVAVGEEVYILPLTSIIASIQPTGTELKQVSGRGVMIYAYDQYIPLVRVYELFNLQPLAREIYEGIVVIVEAGEQKAALLVDDLLGQHQVVIKSLETNYRKVEGVSGATILGDGRVALILDAAEIIQMRKPRMH
ncbi:two-component system, chemotaxis family, sensor kinase CheA [Allopseudospirillum japonicum]|uniref:Chemotaxis protein CheA n=1 Tax=Allopseudospirillum japonicum TaxID=64971 RepID=A0A1H6RY37_9GAMM|nr:chemotaxis protein CheW [Allopseudospirillum japonicum]SEI60611.1 two-component system, chemotaxis family, sensor kinase CheA [Allopseudospirillum japonicum]